MDDIFNIDNFSNPRMFRNFLNNMAYAMDIRSTSCTDEILINGDVYSLILSSLVDNDPYRCPECDMTFEMSNTYDISCKCRDCGKYVGKTYGDVNKQNEFCKLYGVVLCTCVRPLVLGLTRPPPLMRAGRVIDGICLNPAYVKVPVCNTCGKKERMSDGKYYCEPERFTWCDCLHHSHFYVCDNVYQTNSQVFIE
jgi:hypothetical protein